ncbi:MAG TPA: PQQ-binding-like beta-propeller repeat protein [Thermoanaerobaculia bacterium]|nr:PQQ-binding-like beta-propeller repeat protein [Thermoanaerobaculia bacterium]
MTRHRSSRRTLRSAIAAAIALAAAAPASANDWPQFGGAGRNFVLEGTGLAPSWPDGGPEVAWRRDLGTGYSGIAVVGDTLYTSYRRGDHEIVLAAATATGATRWEHRYPAPFTSQMSMEHGDGPHTTPLVTGGRVFVAGVRGRLMALDAATGRELWRKELIDELGGTPMDRGYASSPLAYGGNVVVSVGGRGQGVVAFDQETGERRWGAGDFAGSYSSPFVIELGGEDQLVLFTSDSVVGLDPGGGENSWSHRHPTQYGLNISVPLWIEGGDGSGILFVSSAYDGGSRALRLTREGDETRVEELWSHKEMRLHISNAIHIDGVVYASSGDFGPVPMTAVDLTSGEILWRDRAVARANLLRVGHDLLFLDEDGVLHYGRATREELAIRSQVDLFQTRTWTGPTLSGKRLYARDQATLVALELP